MRRIRGLGSARLWVVAIAACSVVGQSATAGGGKTTKVATSHFGDVEIADGSVILMDGGMHGVQGHQLFVDAGGHARWVRRLDSFAPHGRAGSGTTTLTAAERTRLAAWTDAAWKRAEKTRHASFYPDISRGIPRRVWILVMRRGDEVRTLEGGEVGGGKPPDVAAPALSWLVARVDALASDESSPAAEPPLLINDRLVDPTDGHVRAKIAGVDHWRTAVPRHDGTHHFQIDDRLVDGRTGKTIAHLTRLAVEKGHLVRRSPDGKVRWRVPLPGVRSVRPPDVALAPGVALASVDDRVFAFDDATGRRLWHAPGPADRLATDGKLVFTTDCSVHGGHRWLVARHVKNGKRAWRASLSAKMDPDALVFAGRFIVVTNESPDLAIFLDHSGKRHFASKEALSSVRPLEDDLLLVSSKRVARVDAKGHVLWHRPPLASTFVAGNDIVPVGGDLLIANFGRIDDSGVDVVRLDAKTGALRWETRVPGLGVAHSKYYQAAYLEMRGTEVYVVSQGAFGSFFERLDLATGHRELRCMLDDPKKKGCTRP